MPVLLTHIIALLVHFPLPAFPSFAPQCHAPPTTPFEVAIGPLASEAGAPPVCSLRTIKSDVVVGIKGEDAERLDKDEPGWKISGKYAIVLLSEGHKGEKVQLV